MPNLISPTGTIVHLTLNLALALTLALILNLTLGSVFHAWTRAMNTRGVVLDEVVLMQAGSVAASPRGQGFERRVERAGPGFGRAMGGSPKSNGESDDEEEVLMVAPNYALGARSGGMSPNENPPRDVARALGLGESTDEVLMIRPPER